MIINYVNNIINTFVITQYRVFTIPTDKFQKSSKM